MRRGRFGPWLLLTLVVAMAVAWAALTLMSGRPLVAPRWLTDRVEAQATVALNGAVRVELGDIVAVLDEGRVPRLVMRDLRLLNTVGAEVASLPEMRARLSADALLGGEFALHRLSVVGAELTLRRDRNGRFDLAFGSQDGALAGVRSLPEILGMIDRVFANPALSGLDSIGVEGLRLTFQDARTDRLWRAENGRLTIRQESDRRSLSLNFVLAGGAGQTPADVRLAVSAPRGGGPVELAADVSNIAAADVAGQIPALAWLVATDAPLSANLRGRLGPEGALREFAGALEIGAGAIDPGGAARPVAFDGAKLYINFDPAAGRIDFTEVVATMPEAEFRARGHAYLQDVDPASGFPGRLLVQLALSEVELNPARELAEPAQFESGTADMRLTLAPLGLEVGQITLVSGGRRFQAEGQIAAMPDGWDVAMDFALDEISHDRLFALWPLRVVPRTRRWLTENVTQGHLYDVDAALRLKPGTEPRFALDYEFRNGTVQFLRTMPPVTDGSGHASIVGNRFTTVVASGQLTAPNGEIIDASGTVFKLRDITQRPGHAEIRLRTDSSIPAILSVLDLPPFEFLSKAGRPTDLAEGRAVTSSVIRLPLKRKVHPSEVDLFVTGRLRDVQSATLVPGRELTAETLALNASLDGMSISGPVRVGQARFDAAWNQRFGPDANGSRAEGIATLDQAFLDEFGIALPPGTVRGEGVGQIIVELPKDGPARFLLVSDLKRLRLSVPPIGWSKGPAAAGRLEVAGTLGQPPSIERLVLSAPGLEAEGRVNLTAEGSFDSLRLSRFRVGQWLDGPVQLTARGPGQAPAVAVTGGTIDLRRTQIGGRGNGRSGPITLALNRLVVSDGIAFSDFRADLTNQNGLNGRFSGSLGGTRVQGVLAPTREGTAVRLQSADAGAILRSSGFLDSARQGVLDLTLIPLQGEGRYDGRLVINNLRLRGAPALADLLSAISVVGLLEQLNGQGIVFNEVSGEFTLEPRGITVRRGSATGASLGVSMSGIYDLRSRTIDMQGTISPIYLINGVGQLVSRRGEGLFGFNYRMTGPASAPRTTVNPLSILTPGMFREIFRAPPPRLAE